MVGGMWTLLTICYILKIFFFSHKMDFDILCKETICMKCQSLFTGKNNENVNLSYAEFVQRVVEIKKAEDNAGKVESSLASCLLLMKRQLLIIFYRVPPSETWTTCD